MQAHSKPINRTEVVKKTGPEEDFKWNLIVIQRYDMDLTDIRNGTVGTGNGILQSESDPK